MDTSNSSKGRHSDRWLVYFGHVTHMRLSDWLHTRVTPFTTFDSFAALAWPVLSPVSISQLTSVIGKAKKRGLSRSGIKYFFPRFIKRKHWTMQHGNNDNKEISLKAALHFLKASVTVLRLNMHAYDKNFNGFNRKSFTTPRIITFHTSEVGFSSDFELSTTKTTDTQPVEAISLELISDTCKTISYTWHWLCFFRKLT